MKQKQRRSDWWNKDHVSLTDFLRSQSCCPQFCGPADCEQHVPTINHKPLHSISKELLPCMCVCVCVFGRESLSCEQRGFAQTYCMIKLWLYFSPLLMLLRQKTVANHPSVLQYVGLILLWFTVVTLRLCSIVWTNKYAFLEITVCLSYIAKRPVIDFDLSLQSQLFSS